MLNKLLFEGLLLKEGDFTSLNPNVGREGDFLDVLLEILGDQVQSQGVQLGESSEQNLLPEELLKLLNQKSALPKEEQGGENLLLQELATEAEASDKKEVEENQPDLLRLIASLKTFLPEIGDRIPPETPEDSKVSETFQDSKGRERLSELLKTLLASREFSSRAESPAPQFSKSEYLQREDAQQVNFTSHNEEANLQALAKAHVFRENPKQSSELFRQVEEVVKGQEHLKAVSEEPSENPIKAEVGKNQQNFAFSENKVERVSANVKTSENTDNPEPVQQKQESLPKNLKAKLETAVNSTNEPKNPSRADLKPDAAERTVNLKESPQKANASAELSARPEQSEVKKANPNTASPVADNFKRRGNPKVENAKFELKETQKAEVPKRDTPADDIVQSERNPRPREVKDLRISAEQGRVTPVTQETKGKERVEPRAERLQKNDLPLSRVQSESEEPQPAGFQRTDQQPVKTFGQVKDITENNPFVEREGIEGRGAEKATAKGSVKPEETRTVGFDFSQGVRDDVEAEEVQHIQRKETPLPEQRQTAKNLSLRFEDVNLRFRFQSNYLSVDVRSQENLESKLSYLDVQRLAKSLEGLGLSLSALRVNGTEFTPKNPKYSKREERQRFNIRENERVTEEALNTGANSANINLLL